jgi:dCTP diphosphatase
MMNIEKIQKKISKFAEDRDWEQYHTPKNLSMALVVEASELLEIFQWLTPDESIKIRESESDMEFINEEIADISIYLFRLCGKLGVDLETAILNKIQSNTEKYPVELAKGNATKYNRR